MKTSILAVFLVLIVATGWARYYDAALGRFISADTIVPEPADPQSLNRYAYVRNNPLKYTDPSGHSWVSKISQQFNQHFIQNGIMLQTVDVFSGSAALASRAEGRAVLAGQAIAAGSFGAGGAAAGWGAVSGELSSVYAAQKNGGDMMSAVVIGGLEGAAISSAFAGVDGLQGANWMGQGMAKAGLNAAVAAAHGADSNGMWRAAAYTFGAHAAGTYFQRTVGYAADPTPGVSLPGPKHTYETIRPSAKLDVFGKNDGKGGIWHQGSPAMRTASSVPGMQAVSQLHDTWLNAAPKLLMNNATITNFSTMIPAFAVSYGAQFSGPFAPIIPFMMSE